jgi:hypothetical protein
MTSRAPMLLVGSEREILARLTQFAAKCERNQWRHLKSLHYSEGVFQVPRGFSLAEDVRSRSLLSIPVVEYPLGLHYSSAPATGRPALHETFSPVASHVIAVGPEVGFLLGAKSPYYSLIRGASNTHTETKGRHRCSGSPFSRVHP